MNPDLTTIIVPLAIVAEMRWAIARLDRRVASLEDTKADKPHKRGASAARVGLWLIAGMLLMSGCAGRDLLPPPPVERAPVAAAVLAVLPWCASILAIGGIVCAVLAVLLKEWRWVLGSVAAAAGIAVAVALEWAVPFLPWVVVLAVAAGAGYGAWYLYQHRLALRLTAEHGDRMEAVQDAPSPVAVDLLNVKLRAARDQAAAGVHDLIRRTRGKPKVPHVRHP